MTLCIATEYSKFPGPRFKHEGRHSAEEFRNNLLEPRFQEAQRSGKRLLVDLDGGYGYATSFLEEAFGGLARIHGPDVVLRALRFRSNDEPYLVDDVRRYILEAKTGVARR